MSRRSSTSSRTVLSVLAVVMAVLLFPRGARADPELPFEVVAHETPRAWCAGEGRPVRVELRNVGSTSWSPERGDRIAYHWLDGAGEPVVYEGRRTPLSHAVSPGGTIELDAIVEAPPMAGTHHLQWAMVRENVRWSPSAPEPFPVIVRATGSDQALRWAIEDDAEGGWVDDGSLGANGSRTVEVALRNTGCATWSAAAGDALSYHWLDADGETIVWDGVRTPLPTLATGERATVRGRIVAPPRPGRYRLVWELVRENVTWYGAPTHGQRGLDVEVGAPELGWSMTHGGEPPQLHASHTVTVELGLRNDGVRAWSHADGDRISYRWQRVGVEDAEPVEGLRTMLEEPVPPGETTVVQARLQAPPEPGRYRLSWEPVREDVAWYGPPLRSESPRDVTVEVDDALLAWTLEAVDEPRWVWATRTRTLRVVVRNAGAGAWSPEDGDRLSYRWLDEDGEIIVGDGARTLLPQVVEPGDSITLDMRVTGPDLPGRHVLVVAMVREHVQWYGPPREGTPEVSVRVVRVSAALGVGFLALAGLAVVARARSAGHERVLAIAGTFVLPLGVALAVFVLCETFFDHAGIEIWSGARWWSFSGALLWGLAVVASPARARPFLAVTMVAGLSALCLADLAYVHFFGSIVPLGAMMAVHQLGDTTGTVSSLLDPGYLWFLPPVLGVLVLALLGPRSVAGTAPRVRRVALACFVVGALPASFELARFTFGGMGMRVFSETQNVGRLGVVNAHLFQVGRALRSMGGRSVLRDEDRREVATFLAERTPTRSGARFGVARGSNLVVLQVEALQDWVVDAEIDGRPVMPFLASASGEALRLTQVFDQTAQGRTSDAEYLVLAAGHPLAEGALCFLRENAGFHTWAHALAEHGYTTLSAHPYKRGFWNRATLHPRYGFETSLFRRELGEGPVVGWGLADGPFLERMAARLDGLDAPFAALLITLSLHHPYETFPSKLQTFDVGDLEGTPLGNYLHAMHYFDRSLQAFVEDLRRRGLLDRTVLLVFGDHVAQLEETPRMLQLAGVQSWSPAVPKRSHRVAAFVWSPDGLAGEVDRVGGQIDLGPTVLHLLGVPSPPSFLGRPLVERGPGFAALPDGSAVTDDRMFVATGRDIGREGACFDHPEGGSRPLEDCRALARRAERELTVSRRMLDHDLFRALPEP